ncbi:MAG: hypothetical protein K5893_00780 [Prevotella sp.]|nr:hypothetical protein [Prevotella sp.]
MEKKYTKPSIRVIQMLMKNYINAASESLPAKEDKVSASDADAKSIGWSDFMEKE